jgi:hypothetical protein
VTLAVLVLELAVAAGCDLDRVDKYGWTPLMLSVRLGSLGMTAGLLENGADVEFCNSAGQNALSIAKKLGNRGQLSLLRRFIGTLSGPMTAVSGSVVSDEAHERYWDHTIGLLSSFHTSGDEEIARKASLSLGNLFRLMAKGKTVISRESLTSLSTSTEAEMIDHLVGGNNAIDERQFGVILMALAGN